MNGTIFFVQRDVFFSIFLSNRKLSVMSKRPQESSSKEGSAVARRNHKLDQSCVSSRDRKLTRNINRNPTMFSLVMKLQALPAPGNWSEVRTSDSESRQRITWNWWRTFGFERNIVPGLTSLEILQKIQKDLQVRNMEPEKFEDRIVFMSMFNDIEWTQRGNSEIYFKFWTPRELREEILARTQDIPRPWRRKEMVWSSQLYTWKKMGFNHDTNGGTIQRDESSNIQKHQCFESWTSEKGGWQRHHTLHCGCVKHRTLISNDSLSKSAQYLRSSLQLMHWRMGNRKKKILWCGLQGVMIPYCDKCLQNFQHWRKKSNLHKFRRCVFLTKSLFLMCYYTVADVDGFGDRTPACREFSHTRAGSDSRIYVAIAERTTIGPFLQVHILLFLVTYEIEIPFPSTTTPDRNSWVAICQGKNRFVVITSQRSRTQSHE